MTLTPADPCFFILGYGRSGTTLFRKMLSAHPQLFVPPENDVFQRLPPIMGRRVEDMHDLDEVVASFPPYYERIYDTSRFAEEAAQQLPLTAAELLVTLLGTSRIAEGKSGPMWGHKAPSEWPYIGTWRQWFPSAKFLHLVRHPHDSTASMIQHQLQRYRTTPLVAIWQWRAAFNAIRRHGAELGPERYLMLRYEELVTDPVETLAAVCAFLGVSGDAVEVMVDYRSDESAGHLDEGAHMAQTEKSVTFERIGRSKGEYSQSQAAMLDHVCRAELEMLGYDRRAASPPNAAQRLAYDAACAALDLTWAGLRATRKARGQL